ncbi:MAG TPA: hypothetical protein VLN73_00155 [Alphaproteobacteria bacterium]|nr:hypothetical protein [Alphaproteobacteria bacterium]
METVLYIGTEQGVITAKSADGRSWEIAEHGLKTWGVPEVAVAPGQPNKVYAGTRGDGVWVSEDFGHSWVKPCYGRRGPGKVRCVTIDPHEPKRIYAGCEPIDLFVSEDDGANWTRFPNIWDIPFVSTIPYPVATVEPHLRDLAIHPDDPDTLYAALQVGYMLKSTDRGKSWRLLDENIDCDVHTVAIDPQAPDRLLIATGGNGYRAGDAPGRALYLSEDGGESWSPTAMNFENEYSVPVTIDPFEPARVYSALGKGAPGGWRKRETGAESVVIRSLDGGRNWQQVAGGISRSDFPEAIVTDEETEGRLYAACRNGTFYGSDDAGENWSPLDLGLNVRDLRSVVHAAA